MFVADVKCP